MMGMASNKILIALLAYLLLLHGAAVLIVLKPSLSRRAAAWLGMRSTDRQDDYRSQMQAFHTRVDATVPDGSVLLFGDSLIQGLCVSAVADKAVNFGIGGDTADRTLSRLRNSTSAGRARALVIDVGFNDLPRQSNATILASYRAILDTVGDGVGVVFCLMHPVDERVTDGISNQRIRELNDATTALCAQYANCRMVDITADVTDGSGNLRGDLHVGDGVHLSGEGYRIWIRHVKTALDTLSDQAAAAL